jgi:hypothetical protein
MRYLTKFEVFKKASEQLIEKEKSKEQPKEGSGDVVLKNEFSHRKSIIYKGEKVGYVEVPTDLEGDTISLGDINIKLEFRNKGIAVEVYKILIKELDKPLESFSRTPEAKRVWDSLVKQGLAKKEGDKYISIKASSRTIPKRNTQTNKNRYQSQSINHELSQDRRSFL